MATQGGRDIELDLFGCPGGYKTILSKNTANKPCPVCSTLIKKEIYLGGIYITAKHARGSNKLSFPLYENLALVYNIENHRKYLL